MSIHEMIEDLNSRKEQIKELTKEARALAEQIEAEQAFEFKDWMGQQVPQLYEKLTELGFTNIGLNYGGSVLTTVEDPGWVVALAFKPDAGKVLDTEFRTSIRQPVVSDYRSPTDCIYAICKLIDKTEKVLKEYGYEIPSSEVKFDE